MKRHSLRTKHRSMALRNRTWRTCPRPHKATPSGGSDPVINANNQCVPLFLLIAGVCLFVARRPIHRTTTSEQFPSARSTSSRSSNSFSWQFSAVSVSLLCLTWRWSFLFCFCSFSLSGILTFSTLVILSCHLDCLSCVCREECVAVQRQLPTMTFWC